MGRKQLISQDQFIKAYKKSKSITQLSTHLNICAITVRNYLTKYQLSLPMSPINQKKEQLEAKVFKHYRGLITLRFLANKFNLPLQTIRYYINKQ